MSAQPGFLLSPELLGKVRTTIARVDGDIPGRKSWTIPTRFEGEEGGGGGKVFRICTFTGAWSIETDKTVTFKYETTTPNTVVATNLFMHLPVVGVATAFDCGVAKDGTAWFLVSALEHNVKRGTASAPWTKGSSAVVTLVSGGTVTALNRHADVPSAGTKNVSIARDGMEWELIAAECD